MHVATPSRPRACVYINYYNSSLRDACERTSNDCGETGLACMLRFTSAATELVCRVHEPNFFLPTERGKGARAPCAPPQIRHCIYMQYMSIYTRTHVHVHVYTDWATHQTSSIVSLLMSRTAWGVTCTMRPPATFPQWKVCWSAASPARSSSSTSSPRRLSTLGCEGVRG